MINIMATVLVATVGTTAVHGNTKILNLEAIVEGANDEWTPTNIKLEPGDVLICKAIGSVKITPSSAPTGANGRPDGVGALQIKIGTTTVRTIGTKAIVEDVTGLVKLRVLDSVYTDNSGAFNVQLIKIPAEMIPAPIGLDGEIESVESQLGMDVQRRMDTVKGCYAEALKRNPHASGRVVMQWRIETDGTVNGVSVKSQTLDDGDVGNCMQAKIAEWHFQRHSGPAAEVEFPFTMQASQ